MPRLSSPFRNPAPATRVADRLHSAAIHLLRRLRKQDEATGLGAARLSALSVVVFAGPLALGELARAEQVKPPTMTRIVNGLVRAGLVKREVDREDRRVARVRATPKGVRVLQAGRRLRVQALAGELRQVTRRQVALLGEAAALMERVAQRRQRIEEREKK